MLFLFIMKKIPVKMYLMYFCMLLATNIKTLSTEEKCPMKCSCKRNNQNDEYLRMACGGREEGKIFHLDELELLDLASELVQLNLSNNTLKSFSPKVELIVLQKLDLSNNQLTELQAQQFAEVPKLRRLDLSANSIRYIDLLAFDKLRHLERLKLNQNQISAIVLGTFDPLESIKQLDISNNPLVCDCSLLWLHDWSERTKNVKLMSNPKCASPSTFKGRSLRKLRIGDDIHCKSPAGTKGLPIVELKPRENQVVFEGDPLTIQCFAPSISDSLEAHSRLTIQWSWLGSDPKLFFSNLRIENETLGSAGKICSTLSVPKLEKNHTGVWNCLFSSIHGNYSKGLSIIVISDDTKYCPMTVVSNNKGIYNWPRTIVNHTVSIPCEILNLNYDASFQKATYSCTSSGEWANLNTSMCSYISDTTKILHQFSMVNESIEESAKHFKNYTSNVDIFRDVMDLVYAVSTIENYIKFAPAEHIGIIGANLVDSVNNLMELPADYIREADVEYDVCKRLVNATEFLAEISKSNLHKSNLALEVFKVKKEGFQGLKCSWYVNPNKRKDTLFSCVPSYKQDPAGFQGRGTDASVTIPHTLFQQLPATGGDASRKAYDVLVAMQSSNKLLPIDVGRYGQDDVTSAVVGVKLVGHTVRNLTEPVFIMLRMPSTTIYEVTPFTPVWWDPSLNNGTGKWSSAGCHFTHELQDHLVFSCENFGYYGLLQDVSSLESELILAKFKLSHPAIYIGTFILFASFLVVILTYLLCYVSIQIPKKAKHSLINMLIAIALLCFMYVFGIYQTEDVRVCQIVGMLLHYFTLSSLLWMCVAVNCMYKRLSKNDIINIQDDDLPLDQPIKKPILGLYLVGWGIGLIICGLSAAINMNEYASPGYCFLRSGPALSALYIPFVILFVFLLVFFLLIRCAIYNLDANGHLSEGTQATEHVDLDLLEPNFPNVDTRSVRSVSLKTASSEVEDPEHAPSAQLKAHVIFLLIYLMTWLSCAFATVPPFRIVSFEEDLFSIAYALLASTLGTFTVFFYCVARNDVRTQWAIVLRSLRRKRLCIRFRSRNVSDAFISVPQIQIQPLPLPPVCNIDNQISRSTSRSSAHTKTNSHASNVYKDAVDLNGSFSDHQGAKINNVNLVVLHRAQYRSNVIPNIIENPTNAAEVFYNPHQSTVARKFFKRQKRNMLKKTNLLKPPRDVNSDTASVFSEPNLKIKNMSENNIFGTNSKVNNTNIHVEFKRNIQQKNPNIFSDSTEEFDSVSNVPVAHLVYNAERLRKKELGKKKKYNVPNAQTSELSEKHMRSISQQCTLEYSSETISDSILDKNSPEKSLLPDQESFLTEANGGAALQRQQISSFSTLTDNDPNYCQIAELKGDSSRGNGYSSKKPEPFSSDVEGSSSRLFVNPSLDSRLGKGDGQSRASSVSVSDLDELYQQIRRGPQAKRSRNFYSMYNASPCLSDSEINSFVSDNRQRRKISHSHEDFDRLSDDVETTV
ncbi:unnamed protein product [Phaedon cochleariae]|uniref:Adhesion G protein-coupled receptor A3 n=1 Tax=Phaedon cochleariae TaxID=80249 RepID=A0A9N9SF33_PHACE|nr:unnamed protein product [Phaedon cochleariae]